MGLRWVGGASSPPKLAVSVVVKGERVKGTSTRHASTALEFSRFKLVCTCVVATIGSDKEEWRAPDSSPALAAT